MPSARAASMTPSSRKTAWWRVPGRVWEERLRLADQIEHEYNAWRRDEAVTISESDRREILGLGEDLPRLWNATTTASADRKQIIRLVVKDVTLDQKRRRGYVWIKLFGRQVRQASIGCIRTYYAFRSTLIRTVCASASSSSMASKRWMARSPTSSIRRHSRAAHGPPFSGGMIHQLRKRWQIATVKISGIAANPPRWPDGTYSVPGRRGSHRHHPTGNIRLARRGAADRDQLAKGMPWQITLTPEQAIELRAKVRHAQPIKERRHESVESPNGHSPNARLVVTMTEVRS